MIPRIMKLNRFTVRIKKYNKRLIFPGIIFYYGNDKDYFPILTFDDGPEYYVIETNTDKELEQLIEQYGGVNGQFIAEFIKLKMFL